MNNTIELIRGDTVFLHIELTDENGLPYELRPTDKLVFTVKRSIYHNDIIIQKPITSTMDIIIEHDETCNLKYGSYIYDVQLTQQYGVVSTVIEPSPFIVKGEVNYDV